MPGETAHADLTAAAETFAAVRPRLFGIAYRMLGTVADAEDIVQDTWERWQGTDRSAVREPAAFLATTATRLAINQAQSARVRRETYVGPWLPEPVDTSADPLLGAERGEALEFAVLVLLESLSPTERAAYVLREAFDYPYAQIAEIIQGSEASARQLVSRARRHLTEQRHVREADRQEQRRMLEAFLEAPNRATSPSWSGSSPPTSSATPTAAAWRARPASRCSRARRSPSTCARSTPGSGRGPSTSLRRTAVLRRCWCAMGASSPSSRSMSRPTGSGACSGCSTPRS